MEEATSMSLAGSPREQRKFVPIPDVIRSLQRVLNDKEKIIEDQKATIAQLQTTVKSDHATMQKLEESLQSSAAARKQREESQTQFEQRCDSLNSRLSNLTSERSYIAGKIESTKEEIEKVGIECSQLESAVAKLTAAGNSHSNIATLNSTMLALTSEVRALEVANRELSHHRTAIDSDALARQLLTEKSRFEELQAANLRDRNLIHQIDTDIQALRMGNLDLEMNLASEVRRSTALARRANEAEMGRRQPGSERPQRERACQTPKSPRAGGDSSEVRRLTARLRELERRIMHESDRISTAQSRLDDARLHGKTDAVASAMRDVESSSSDYLAMKREKRAIEEQLDRLKALNNELRDELHSAERVTDQLRRELIESRRRPIVMQPVYLDEDEPRLGGFVGRERVWTDRTDMDEIGRQNDRLDRRIHRLSCEVREAQDVRRSYFPTNAYGRV